MLINLKVKTLDAQTHEFSIDNEITIREFKDKIAEKTNIAADQQRIIYCGRVLVDEKQLKEYDVDGKVVHVAERPPPSQRGPSTSGANTNDTPTVRERSANRSGMRSSPLFRALDGMVVGTMAIPMNSVQNNGQPPINPFAASSSFCMNRITVARHMLECANNIAAYLEDPERGLNNTSLDILARGSWTMESTVVEVGITATDLPQNQNIVEMVQDAVSAALRRNSNTTNVTVVQLPTVFGPSEGDAGTLEGPQNAVDNMETNASAGDAADAAAVIIEDVIEDGEDGIGVNVSATSDAADSETTNNTNSSRNVTLSDTSTDNANNSTTTGTNTDENPSRRRTNTNVLAEVIDHMRTVQTRLNPFIQQYYELLRNEPTFEENDTTGRENAQRLYNRVSEAFHYMSHAQHAISDLMLDVSQPAPRFLTCRPILVEQSGYVSSNNYLSAAAAAAGTGNQARPRTRTYISPRYNHPISITTSPPTAAAPSTAASSSAGGGNNSGNGNTNGNEGASNGASGSGSSGSSSGNANTVVEDPVDDPAIAPDITIGGGSSTNAGTQSNDNPQVQMSRLIQAVVNSAPIDTEFHVQILPPTILSVPVNAAQAQAQSGSRAAAANNEQQRPAAATAAASAAAASSSGNNSGNNSSNASTESTTSPNANTPVALGGNANQARVNTATLPTTSTQTRSTSRPQLQIGSLPANGWNGRFIPANMMSSFDRFLPCNSHHIREPDNSGNNNGSANGNGSSNANSNANTPTPQIINTNTVNPRTMLTLAHLMQRARPTTTSVGGTPPTTTRPTSGRGPPVPQFNFLEARNLYETLDYAALSSLASAATNGPATAGTDTYRRNLRTQLLSFLNQRIFEGAPINEESITTAVNRAASWFGESLTLLPQYEKPEYDSRDSVINILRRTLPKLIEAVCDNQESPASFERRLKQICEEFVKRLYSVLFVCVGRSNAELYWGQLMRLLLIPMQSNFRDEALHFLCVYINTDIPSTTDTVDAQQFIVHRNKLQTQDKPTPMETDVEMVEVASTSEVSAASKQIPTAELDDDITAMEQAPEEPLPSVVAGSESWHRNFPNDWLPIITHDLHTQTTNPPSQTPFSDAYISGMSAKRRKMIQSSKPPTDINSLVARSVRKAIQTVGVRASTASNQSLNADDVTDAIASDATVSSVYTEAVRTNVRERLKKDPDYKADKYPQATKFINK